MQPVSPTPILTEAGWRDLVLAALSGGAILKFAEYAYSEFRQRVATRKTARALVARHLDPLLKSADEVVAKIASLAREDFTEFRHAQHDSDRIADQISHTSLLYLLGQLWARVQILRLESEYADLARDRQGRKIRAFFFALESTRNRLVERAWQRAIGECLIIRTEGTYSVSTYREFVDRYMSESRLREWFSPLSNLLNRCHHTRVRQRLLLYGVLLNAFVDTLDPKHEVSRNRPPWPNKLSRKSRRELQHRVFSVYLPFVKRPERYWQLARPTKK
jgi:hypothetical protein